MNTILVPTDYSACSLDALKYATTLARESNCRLLILHVSLPQTSSDWGGVLPDASPLWQNMELLVQKLNEGQRPVQIHERQVEGDPASEIVWLAQQEHVGLIVMGTAGRTGLKRILLGSVAEEVVRHAHCPVMVLRSHSEINANEEWRQLTTLVPPTIASDIEDDSEASSNPTLALISRAIAARATDIHIDPNNSGFEVRFRIDGQLSGYAQLSAEVGRSLLTQMKVMASLDIADPFHSKEGRLKLPDSMKNYEARITSVPVLGGEAVSLRVLNRRRLMRPMEELGMSCDCHDRINRILQHRKGLVLVTGPTGSGKTTTLYSMLHALDDGSRNIVTIEDPVEFNIPTFRQLPVDCRHGATMNSGLRTLLRLDPDIVLVGEIRDIEAAETAMRAASSGKHVFSSLHTRDVASTVTALRDLRIDNRSIAGNLAGIVSQTLIRRLCAECCEAVPVSSLEKEYIENAGLQAPEELRRPVGCHRCAGTGYYDRIGLFEVVTPADQVLQVIEDGGSESEIRMALRSRGIPDLQMEALKNAIAGITSMAECQRMI